MEINSIKTYNKNAPSFKSLLRLSSDFKKPMDSFFYRELPSLKKMAKLNSDKFEKGLILNVACSNGEELWSLFSLFKNPDRFKIIGLDISKDAIDLAKNGLHTVFSSGAPDSFLVKPSIFLTPEHMLLKSKFRKIFNKSDIQDFTINNSPTLQELKQENPFLKEHFFEIKQNYKNNSEFILFDAAKINDLDTGGEQVNSILFKNAFYHPIHNDIDEALSYGYIKNNEIDRQAVAQEIIDSFHSKIKTGGFLALGSHPKDHFVLADNFTRAENIVLVKDIQSHKNAKEAFAQIPELVLRTKFKTPLQLQNYVNMMKTIGEMKLCKKSPIQLALEKDGRFIPIYKSPVRLTTSLIDEMGMYPTIWQKVK